MKNLTELKAMTAQQKVADCVTISLVSTTSLMSLSFQGVGVRDFALWLSPSFYVGRRAGFGLVWAWAYGIVQDEVLMLVR